MPYSATFILTVTTALLLATGMPGPLGAADTDIAKIIVEPTSIALFEADKGHGVLVTGVNQDGGKVDLTAEAKLEAVSGNARIGEDGLIYGTGQGEAQVNVSAGGHSAQVSVTVHDMSQERSLTFVRDVMPVLNKVGCTTGACHGSAKGKNGFKLSLRGYDPKFDYAALLYEISGRRVNRAAPRRELDDSQADPSRSPSGRFMY